MDQLVLGSIRHVCQRDAGLWLAMSCVRASRGDPKKLGYRAGMGKIHSQGETIFLELGGCPETRDP